jgi:flagellar protein FliO/FliZ
MGDKVCVILQKIVDEVNNISPTPSINLNTAGEAAEKTIPSGSAWDSFIQLIGLVIILILILIATYYTTRFVGNVKLGQMKNSNFKLIDAYRISPNKVVQIVKIGNKYIVLGIGKDTVNYITELDEEQVTVRDYQTREKVSFTQLLDKIRNNK